MAGPRWQPVPLKDVPAPAGAYTPAVKAGPFVFVSGQVPRDRTSGELVGTTVVEQTRKVMENVRDALGAAGATLQDVVSVNVYLADPSLWGDFDRTYREFMQPPYPTRTAVGAALRGILVEISVTAYVG